MTNQEAISIATSLKLNIAISKLRSREDAIYGEVEKVFGNQRKVTDEDIAYLEQVFGS